MASTINKIPALWDVRNIVRLFPPYTDYRFFYEADLYPFRHGVSGYNKVNAWWLSELSALAYHPQRVIEAYLTQWLNIPASAFIRLQYGGIQGIAFDWRGEYFVVFQGTEFPRPAQLSFDSVLNTWQNMLTNTDFIFKQADMAVHNDVGRVVRVHRGFESALDGVWQRLNRFIVKDQPVWLAGHSLGGALATLAALRWHDKTISGVYTFGTPCVGDESLVEYFDNHLANKMFRFVNDDDVIVHIMTFRAFTRHFGRYQHAGNRIIMDVKPEFGWFSPLGWLWNGSQRNLVDHSPLLYMHGTRMMV